VVGAVAPSRRKLVVGNWKMNGSVAANAALLDALKTASLGLAEVSVCVPAPYLRDVATALAGSAIAWGGQDCSQHASGAYTGEVSAAMLAELGCRHVIVGHSERRAMHGESDPLVAAKAAAALAQCRDPDLQPDCPSARAHNQTSAPRKGSEFGQKTRLLQHCAEVMRMPSR